MATRFSVVLMPTNGDRRCEGCYVTAMSFNDAGQQALAQMAVLDPDVEWQVMIVEVVK